MTKVGTLLLGFLRLCRIFSFPSFSGMMPLWGIVNLLHVNMLMWEGAPCFPHSQCLRCGGKAGDVPPEVKSLSHLLAIRGGRKLVSPRVEVLGNRTIRGQESLSVPGGLDPLRASLLLPGGLVGIFRTVVERAVLPMLDAG
jgi:hypothetical protein